MPRQCPSCGLNMGRLVADRSRKSGTKWYQFSRTRAHCPECKVEVLPINRPLGNYFEALMLLSAVAFTVFFIQIDHQTNFGTPIWPFVAALAAYVVILVAGFCLKKWGRDYVLASREKT
jgi:rubredoxin